MNTNDKLELAARVAHEANRAFCILNNDHSQVTWDQAEEWQKDSARAGVKLVMEGNTDPAVQHEAWSQDKIAAGWSYGPVKDAAAKTHPCLVPYGLLPEFQRQKDSLFIASALAVLKTFPTIRIPQDLAEEDMG